MQGLQVFRLRCCTAELRGYDWDSWQNLHVNMILEDMIVNELREEKKTIKC
jgi:hypothetical protein